ncbi:MULTISPECIES: hypothetical protein [unclassified Microbacterium]|uniref:hypothetical protein n=1 Tax=unclassified Microbacterium TaxID=2609290 RepID=UPI002883097C|nr:MULTISPECIES: hypothetical protein [unclassified Microbacterium]
MPAPQHLHIQPAVNDSPGSVLVEFAIVRPHDSVPLPGRTEVIRSGDRVWVETTVNGQTLFSNKLDPNDGMNNFDVLRAELAHIEEAFVIPLTSRSTDGAAAIAHAYVSGGRPEWG